MGVRLRRDPHVVVGMGVAYVCAAAAAGDDHDAPFVDGLPVLAAEVLSPEERREDIPAKIVEYLAADVKVVWVVEQLFKTVLAYRPDAEPGLFNATTTLLPPGVARPSRTLLRWSLLCASKTKS